MRVCRICGASQSDGNARCSICGTLLPDQIIPEAGGPPVHETEIKRCEYCGKINEKTAVRCENCGAFLGSTRRIREPQNTPGEQLVLHVSTGETLQITTQTVIGRAYQPQLWDVYSPRAAFRINRTADGGYELENLKTNRKTPLRFHKSYILGRKTFQIEKEG